MKKTLTKILLGLASSSLALLSLNANALGEADGVWLKLKFSAKGYEINTTDGTMKKAATSGACYVNLDYDTDDGEYEGWVVCQDNTGDWQSTGNSFGLSELPNGNLAASSDDSVTFTNSKGHVIQGYGDHILTIKKNKSGQFASATLKTVGSEIIDSTVSPGNGDVWLLGTYTTSGKSIPASKLPFSQ